jgi:hypothetical protein
VGGRLNRKALEAAIDDSGGGKCPVVQPASGRPSTMAHRTMSDSGVVIRFHLQLPAPIVIAVRIRLLSLSHSRPESDPVILAHVEIEGESDRVK